MSLALPWLEVMTPAVRAEAGIKTVAPKRLAFVYVPNGKNMDDWTPDSVGNDFNFKPILEPLSEFKQQVSIVSGLTANKANANGDGNGDHARAMSAFLTGAQPHKTGGINIRAGISADQVVASRLGHLTRLPSLELSCEPPSVPGSCDVGYACVYTSALSWRSATQPLPREVSPRTTFDRLFVSSKSEHQSAVNRRRKSILDFVREDSRDLRHKLSGNDQHKLDEYFNSIREIEQRMERADSFPSVQRLTSADPEHFHTPPESFVQHIELMMDLTVLALQADITRVASLVIANELSNRPYPFIGISDGHHDLSHHGNDPEKKAKIRQINVFHTQQLARMLGRMSSIAEGDRTLLDNTLLIYGSGNSDGNSHSHTDLPVLLAGAAGDAVKQGQHLRFDEGTPLNNLWMTVLDRMDCSVERLGDGTGLLPGLAVE